MVFFSFLFNVDKELHWLGKVEEKMASLVLEAIEVILALIILVTLQSYLPVEIRHDALVSGNAGSSCMWLLIVSAVCFMMPTKAKMQRR